MRQSVAFQRQFHASRTAQQVASKADSLQERIDLCFMNGVNLKPAFRFNVRSIEDFASVDGHECVKAKFYESWEHLGCLGHSKKLWQRVSALRILIAKRLLQRPETMKNKAFVNALQKLILDATTYSSEYSE